MSKKRKAFTLTELLIVVVIVGTLAAVVLPKFTKVIESRKTTEAEEMMAAVRNEQEARCTISKNYVTDKDSLRSYKDGKNFDYTLGDVGMTASARSGKYTLKMPSYVDGRICCDDDYCQNNLNKNYPKCNELPNFIEGNKACSANWQDEPEPEPCDKNPKEELCPNGQPGKIFYGVNENCEYYKTGDTCCDKTPKEEDCPDGQLGKIFYGVNENCEYYKTGDTCMQRPRDCDDSHTEGVEKVACDCNSYKNVAWHCGADTEYKWTSKTDWSTCRDEQREEEDCEHEYKEWDHATCTCKEKACAYTEDSCHDEHGIWYHNCCVCTGGGIEEFDSCKARYGTFNYSTCTCTTKCDEKDAKACQQMGGTFNYNTCECECPGDKVLKDGKCVCNVSASTKANCVNQGGTWNDETCKCVYPSCSWRVEEYQNDIPLPISCDDQRDEAGRPCAFRQADAHGGGPTKECSAKNKGVQFTTCDEYSTCPGGGWRMDFTIYECQCN